MFTDTTLPTPDAAAARVSSVLTEKIESLVRAANNQLPFDEYMHAALYEPALGYYVAGTRKFGIGGDFVTAPEISHLYGITLGRQCAQILEETGGSILEFGGGTGRLAVSVLQALQETKHLPEHYYICELSPELRQRQLATIEEQIPELVDIVCWVTDLPTDLNGVVLANEILDALPVKTFRLQGDELFERTVGVSESGFEWTQCRADQETIGWVEACRKDGCFGEAESFDFEICVALDSWIADLSRILKRGAAILIDYGHARRDIYHADRSNGTLQCYFRHRSHDDPFVLAGIQDITASVDFTKVAEAATQSDLIVSGFCDQANFLIANGLLAELGNLESRLSEDEYVKYSEQTKTLLLPNKMGAQFKVMALTKNYSTAMQGFSLRDDRRYL